MSDMAIGIVGDQRRYDDALGLAMLVCAEVLSVDSGILGCTINHLRVWTKLLQSGHDWSISLEDDAECYGDEPFRDQVARVLADPPADIVSLYLGRSYPRAWQRFIKARMGTDAHWILATHLLHHVAVAIRTDLLPDMLRFIANLEEGQRLWPIDEQVTAWARFRGHPVAYCKPSIVNHRDDRPTLVEHLDGEPRELPRTAWQFGTRSQWDRNKAVTMP